MNLRDRWDDRTARSMGPPRRRPIGLSSCEQHHSRRGEVLTLLAEVIAPADLGIWTMHARRNRRQLVLPRVRGGGRWNGTFVLVSPVRMLSGLMPKASAIPMKITMIMMPPMPPDRPVRGRNRRRPSPGASSQSAATEAAPSPPPCPRRSSMLELP